METSPTSLPFLPYFWRSHFAEGKGEKKFLSFFSSDDASRQQSTGFSHKNNSSINTLFFIQVSKLFCIELQRPILFTLKYGNFSTRLHFLPSFFAQRFFLPPSSLCRPADSRSIRKEWKEGRREEKWKMWWRDGRERRGCWVGKILHPQTLLYHKCCHMQSTQNITFIKRLCSFQTFFWQKKLRNSNVSWLKFAILGIMYWSTLANTTSYCLYTKIFPSDS